MESSNQTVIPKIIPKNSRTTEIGEKEKGQTKEAKGPGRNSAKGTRAPSEISRTKNKTRWKEKRCKLKRFFSHAKGMAIKVLKKGKEKLREGRGPFRRKWENLSKNQERKKK